jgi:hypothetical protein
LEAGCFGSHFLSIEKSLPITRNPRLSFAQLTLLYARDRYWFRPQDAAGRKREFSIWEREINFAIFALLDEAKSTTGPAVTKQEGGFL